MKRRLSALLLGLLLAGFGAAEAAAQQQVQVYVAQDVMAEETAQQLITLAQRAFPQAEITATYGAQTGETLRELVLADRAPQLAICAPEDAAIWAREGLLVPLEPADEERIQEQVLTACMQQDEIYLLPLLARHRVIAVNRQMMEKAHLSFLLDSREHPVWYPVEMQQVLEEFGGDGQSALEIWPADPADSAALEALVQSIYGGALLSEDGVTCQADNSAAINGLTWLRDMVKAGLITYAPDRQTALTRFMRGETALFVDWTDVEARIYASENTDMEIVTVPYPSSSGLPMRSFSVTGAAVFASGDAAVDALAAEIAAFWDEDAQAQLILADRAIWADGAVWLPCLGASERGALLRSAFCEAIRSVMDDGVSPTDAMRTVAATMITAK